MKKASNGEDPMELDDIYTETDRRTMRTLFIETTMGASGDMLLASLIGLMEEPKAFVKRLNEMGIDGLEAECKKGESMGIAGNRLIVRIDGKEEGGHHDHKHHHDHEHHHDDDDHHSKDHHKKDKKDKDKKDRHDKKDKKEKKERAEDSQSIALKVEKEATSKKCCGHFHVDEEGHRSCCKVHAERSSYKEKNGHGKEHGGGPSHHSHNDIASLGDLIDRLQIPSRIKTQAKEIYQILAEAEAIAHGKPSSQIHFHELGEKDAVFDIVGFCLALDDLGVEKILATPIHVGYGKVKTAHGKLPVPAPATAEILKGIPIYSKDIKGELCTPTGAALLKYFVHEFGQMPMATWERIGYGLGSKEFKEPNILRTFLGEIL
ncbi:MAG: LarC family nickel insertion protein [Peptostreptococcaceae bacterium]|nr:LarC family nickel insertion protein [Peptostreptococcaceae bacterium]